MATFLASLVLLFAGYAVYSKVVEKAFKMDDSRTTPAYAVNDGLDYVPMNWLKGWFIQLLNIAGLGPIFGAIAGALYGPVAFIWIVLGSIFAGGVHDYFSGMLSTKHGGAQFPQIVGKYLGKFAKNSTVIVSLILMILVTAAFTAGPAQLLAQVTPLSFIAAIIIIFVYYFVAAILPINQIIGRIYPILGAVIVFMAAAIAGVLIFGDYTIPNLTLANLHPEALPIWPLLMVTISCGAISGFHSTQSVIVSRTLKKESDGRKIFYGAMIGEGVIALIWAAAGMTFFGGTGGLQAALAAGGPAGAVNEISVTMLGSFGGLLAILTVVILPVTTGDTALRSSRMIVMDSISKWVDPTKRLTVIIATTLLAIPAFLLSLIDYSFLWRYVGGTNQLVATIMLWVAVSFLLKEGRAHAHLIAGVPALFMTGVVATYFLYAPEGLNLNYSFSLIVGALVTLVVLALYIRQIFRHKEISANNLLLER